MTLERSVIVDGQAFGVTISDEQTVLRSAYAEGRTVVGLWNREKGNQSLTPAEYVVERPQDADPCFLERAVRRRMGLPWIIGEGSRILIREFTMEDFKNLPRERGGLEEDRVFYDQAAFLSYIRCQYGFYEYGIWAVVEKETGKLAGKAGITGLNAGEEEWLRSSVKKNDTPVELGYHIFSSFRRKGYGKEACERILSYAAENISKTVYARISTDNLPSECLAEKLGFVLTARRENGETPYMCLYEWNC